MNEKFTIAVIGGGPAGSAVALQLARAGIDVCLLEKSEFPREVLCGEFLSYEVARELKSIGSYEKFLALNPNSISSFRFVNDDSTELEVDFKFESFALKRSVFDKFLLDEAELSGAKIYQPAEVKKITRESGEFILDIKDESENIFRLKAQLIIAAYGKKNILDKKLERDFVDNNSGFNGLKYHINKKFIPGFKSDRIDIYSSPGIYCGLNAVNEDEVTLCLLENRNFIHGSPVDHLVQLFRRNRAFAKIFSADFDPGNIRSRAYGTANIHFGRRELFNNGVLMAGDAAGVIAPLAGDGIGMALQTSKILADIIIEEKQRNISPDQIYVKYRIKWDEYFRKRLLTAGIIQKILLSGGLKNAGINIVKRFPSILPYLVKNTRG